MWFKVDDGLHDHAKVRKVDDVAAMGLWVLAGSWCGQNRTDGFIPAAVLRRWSPSSKRLAQKLVDAVMWLPDEVNGEQGYRFHDWADVQPMNDETDTPIARLRWKRKQALKRNRLLCEQVVERDRSLCRYCGCRVNWRDRRGPQGGTYDHIDPDGDNSLGNVVVACRRCNGRKRDRTPPEAGMKLRPEPDPYDATQVETGSEPDRSGRIAQDGTDLDGNQVGSRSDLGGPALVPAHANGNGAH